MDFIIEFFLEIYMELMLLFVPENNLKKKHRILAKIIAIFILLLALALFLWGAVLIVDYDNLLGLIPISVAVLLSALQIIAGIIVYKKKH